MSNLNEVSGSDWGLYPWFEEHGPTLVHSDDLDALRRLSPYGKVFQRTGEEAGYIKLSYGDSVFRVKPELFKTIPPIDFPIGSRVKIQGKGVEAVVKSIDWHYRDAKPIYKLIRDDKPDSRRYSPEDLTAVDAE